jgi:hypothetical protein
MEFASEDRRRDGEHFRRSQPDTHVSSSSGIIAREVFRLRTSVAAVGTELRSLSSALKFGGVGEVEALSSEFFQYRTSVGRPDEYSVKTGRYLFGAGGFCRLSGLGAARNQEQQSAQDKGPQET